MKKLLGIFMAAVTVIAACMGLMGCNGKKSAGTVYSLQAAYDEGFLTKEDLQQIAYYNNKHEKPEKELDPKIEKQIKQFFAYRKTNSGHWDFEFYGGPAKAEDFKIERYCGEYNGCYAFVIGNSYESYPAVEDQEEVAGVTFYYPYPNHIRVYKANN